MLLNFVSACPRGSYRANRCSNGVLKRRSRRGQRGRPCLGQVRIGEYIRTHKSGSF